MSPFPSTDPWPTDLQVSADKRTLTVVFEGGEQHILSAEYLRVCSPSAEVQGHSAAERKTVPGKRQVSISDIKPVGNYAARIVFSDGHDSGLFTWPYLLALGREYETRWAEYLRQLADKGLSR